MIRCSGCHSLFTLLLLLCGSTLYAQDKVSPPLKVSKLVQDVYVHTTYLDLGGNPFPCNGLIINTSKGAVLVDGGCDTLQARHLVKWIHDNLQSQVILCIGTHFHNDRIGGVEFFRKEKIPVISTALTQHLAEKQGVSAPEGVLPEDSVLQIGNISIETFYPGPGHTADNIVVWLPESRILFGGCFIKSTEAKDLGNLKDADIKGWKKSLAKVEKKFDKPFIVVPGHQAWSVGVASLRYTQKLLSAK